MAGTTYNQQSIIRKAIADYRKKYGLTTLRSIAKYVKDMTGIEVPPSTISRILYSEGVRYSGEWTEEQ